MKVSEALNTLITTDIKYGASRGRLKSLEYLLKVAEAQEYLAATGTVDERKSKARTSPDYLSRIREYEDCVIETETLAAERKTAELVIEVWRTQEASKRQGNI